MRYCKGSFVISPEKDIPLLLYVRNCNFISHHQLFEFLQRDFVETSRSSYNWRVQRLLKRHYLEPVTSTRWQGCPVYTIGRDALFELESLGECAVAFNSATRRRRDRGTVYHALELNAIRLALWAQGLLADWKTEMQVGSYNMVAQQPYQKDYDAIVTLLVGDQLHDFALEYERTLKSVKRYEKILEALEAEYQVDCILYLTADPVLLRTLIPRMIPISKSIAFTTAGAVREQSLAAPVLAYPGGGNPYHARAISHVGSLQGTARLSRILKGAPHHRRWLLRLKTVGGRRYRTCSAGPYPIVPA